VKVGDCVKKGQQIAGLGTSGNSSGPHLHFELRKLNCTAYQASCMLVNSSSSFDVVSEYVFEIP
jgi:murein DD-endopeptidase MepM/ murein hydrolase activator NlpD